MKLNSSDLIGRATQTAGRSLLAVSIAAIIVERHDLQPENWGMLNGQLTRDAYQEITILLIVFLSVSLIVHWVADYNFYRNWFKTNNINIGTFWGLGQKSNTEPPVSATKRTLEQLDKANEKLDRSRTDLEETMNAVNPNEDDAKYWIKQSGQLVRVSNTFSNSYSEVVQSVDRLESILDEIDVKFKGVDLIARFVVFVWYLAIPIVVAVAAAVYVLTAQNLAP